MLADGHVLGVCEERRGGRERTVKRRSEVWRGVAGQGV